MGILMKRTLWNTEEFTIKVIFTLFAKISSLLTDLLIYKYQDEYL